MKLGVFGGTFDPPHLGHLIVAGEVHHRLGLDRVLWIPAAVPPHKRDRDITPGHIRLRMVRAAIADDPRFEASDMELKRDGPSYTVDTLRELRADRPDAEIFLILGADQLGEIESWKEPEEIGRLATIVGFARAGEAPPALARSRIVEIPRIDIAATALRRRVREGRPVRYLVSDGVEQIIRRERLYRD
jgi:nicotinate-nucleotide adenylyltransferase